MRPSSRDTSKKTAHCSLRCTPQRRIHRSTRVGHAQGAQVQYQPTSHTLHSQASSPHSSSSSSPASASYGTSPAPARPPAHPRIPIAFPTHLPPPRRGLEADPKDALSRPRLISLVYSFSSLPFSSRTLLMTISIRASSLSFRHPSNTDSHRDSLVFNYFTDDNILPCHDCYM